MTQESPSFAYFLRQEHSSQPRVNECEAMTEAAGDGRNPTLEELVRSIAISSLRSDHPLLGHDLGVMSESATTQPPA
jgi:hypothetical protein